MHTTPNILKPTNVQNKQILFHFFKDLLRDAVVLFGYHVFIIGFMTPYLWYLHGVRRCLSTVDVHRRWYYRSVVDRFRYRFVCFSSPGTFAAHESDANKSRRRRAARTCLRKTKKTAVKKNRQSGLCFLQRHGRRPTSSHTTRFRLGFNGLLNRIKKNISLLSFATDASIRRSPSACKFP